MKVAIYRIRGARGLGIRETFVFAVRLALDRVRELMPARATGQRRPDINSADDSAGMTCAGREGPWLELAAESGLTHTG